MESARDRVNFESDVEDSVVEAWTEIQSGCEVMREKRTDRSGAEPVGRLRKR